MFRDLLGKLKMMLAERKYRRSIDLNSKYFFIRNAVIKWYLDYDKMHGYIDIPAHYRAKKVMNKTIKTPSDIDRCYKKLLEYQKVSA